MTCRCHNGLFNDGFDMIENTVKAVALDFDGLLVDSEPFWHHAEKVVLGDLGINLTEKQSLQTTGFRCDEVMEFWTRKHDCYDPDSCKRLETEVEDLVIEKISSVGVLKDGAEALVKGLMNSNLDVGIVSSSPERILKVGVEKFFPDHQTIPIFSAENEAFGKPHPAVYQRFCKFFNRMGEDCLAFEDSLNGSISAKAAKFQVVAVPECEVDRARFGFVDMVLGSLCDFNLAMLTDH